MSNVYFNRNLAFSSAKDLFYNMAHEINHVSQHVLLKGITASSIKSNLFSHVSEYTAYSHGATLGSTNYGGYASGGPFNHLIPQIIKHPYYSKFLSHNFKWTQTVKFTDIKF